MHERRSKRLLCGNEASEGPPAVVLGMGILANRALPLVLLNIGGRHDAEDNPVGSVVERKLIGVRCDRLLVTRCGAMPNALPLPQPQESENPTKPKSSESRPIAGKAKDGGCWLQGAG